MRIDTSNNLNNIYSQNHLSPKEQREVEKLKAIDAKVKAHEQAHLSAAGGIAVGGAHYSYVTGPDGKKYAIAGEVPISISKGKTPQETIQKMQQVIAAALAPADPSPQDRSVAKKASQEIIQAMKELFSHKNEKDEDKKVHIDIKA